MPYGLGVVLGPGEVAWAEVRACFQYAPPGSALPAPGAGQPAPSQWLATSCRVVGGLEDGRLYGWQWEQVLGCQVGLGVVGQSMSLDVGSPVGQEKLSWSGSRVAPLAVAAVYALYGMEALLEHPGLGCSRQEAPTDDQV